MPLPVPVGGGQRWCVCVHVCTGQRERLKDGIESMCVCLYVEYIQNQEDNGGTSSPLTSGQQKLYVFSIADRKLGPSFKKNKTIPLSAIVSKCSPSDLIRFDVLA